MIHTKVSRRRKDFYHQLTNKLVRDYAQIATEELAVDNMVRTPKAKKTEDGSYAPNGAAAKAGLNRGILDAAPSMLLAFLSYKAEEAGRPLALANTRELKPTQRCHACGQVVRKTLNQRVHSCTCGVELDRNFWRASPRL